MAVTMAVAAGCGGNKIYPVQGKVVFKDGTPLTGGLVVFEPMDPSLHVIARGDIEPDGSFTLSTKVKDDGAYEGRHRVAVMPPLPANLKENLAPLKVPKFAISLHRFFSF